MDYETLRNFILMRIEELTSHKIPDGTVIRWPDPGRWMGTVSVQGKEVKLPEADYAAMNDTELIEAFETIVRRACKQR